MSNQDIALMAHLLRRAGFGATRDELEAYQEKGYEATVEELLNPGDPGNLPDDLIARYHVDQSELRLPDSAAAYWMYRMITTHNPLEEKIVLFWHGLFATGYAKLNQARSHLNQIEMFRKNGLGAFDDLLVELSKDPAMIFWLDNNDNHKGAVNENFGRELLELFSMGIGNYSEDDVKSAARAFTGWTMGNAEYMAMRANKDSIWPYGRIAWHFGYRPEDHDNGEKTFLGETGNLNGEDIVRILCKNEATPRFVCTRLFQFFAADEVDDEGSKVIDEMTRAYFESDYEIRAMLRTLFNSDYFKSDTARFARVKGPIELITGAVRMSGSYQTPNLGIGDVVNQAFYMGQGLLNPPTVEGWHEGEEWIDSGALVERVNFVASELGDVDKPGIRAIIDRLATDLGGRLSPSEVVDRCLDLIGPVVVSDNTRSALTEHVSKRGDVDLTSHERGDEPEQRVGELLSLIAATREFQLA
ncbi:MAG: DUF1800 domain-containing protein [SAR202 cluster bacterium]|nr:DUF1800 domain-containing protein [SAR202 cluster bacterium]